MARAFSKTAGKDYPAIGVKKGETYWYWSVGFRGRKQMSKTRPRPSQLCGSKLSNAYAAQESAEDTIASASTTQEIADALNEAASSIREVAEEYQESFDNLPENFQQSGSAQEMEEKASQLNDWADSLENDASDIEGMDATEYVNEDTDISEIDAELLEDDPSECETCEGTKMVAGEPCDACVDSTNTPTGVVMGKKRKEVSDFDDLTDEEKDAMMEAARETAQQNLDCPL